MMTLLNNKDFFNDNNNNDTKMNILTSGCSFTGT